ncbi:MAG: zinc-dependent alcohol dehydrogenase family protein [Candidatus Cloacimonetes bacterium]|nr:zinc-dependent alcohol dehydrogenase family protein [Candidatus Cloacimonadota bacterium]
MNAMQLTGIMDLSVNDVPLQKVEMEIPLPGQEEILLRVTACGVCHTELDEIEGRTPPPSFPVVPGHEVVGIVESRGEKADQFSVGDRVGVAWIFSACGKCDYCRSGRENLCPSFLATGRDVDGGYAEFMKVHQDFAYAIPSSMSDLEAAPLLCAGAVGYRSLRLTGIRNGQLLGLTGFGASGHLVLKLVRQQYPGTEIFVFARNAAERDLAGKLGAVWTGDTTDIAPRKLDAIIDTTPVWKPVVEALQNLKPGGRLVINAIRKEHFDREYLMKIDYSNHLWLEKEIKSVANVTRQDVSEFLRLAEIMKLQPLVQQYDLLEANKALLELKRGEIEGAKVLKIY